ncbi:MAG TPA: Hpt domain-containing protein [Opitutaceae bacterium]|nr:Hpt domain-containing protein [Opitutaceae bacterium]
MSQQPPNESVDALSAVLGEEATKEIVRLYLSSFPETLRNLVDGSREDQLRLIHGVKSSSLHMGATELSERLAAIEARLTKGDAVLTQQDLDSIEAGYTEVEPALRQYGAS